MSLARKIFEKIEKLPEVVQAEILDFVDFLDLKKNHPSDSQWGHFSLSSAMRGMESESSPEYTLPSHLKGL